MGNNKETALIYKDYIWVTVKKYTVIYVNKLKLHYNFGVYRSANFFFLFIRFKSDETIKKLWLSL